MSHQLSKSELCCWQTWWTQRFTKSVRQIFFADQTRERMRWDLAKMMARWEPVGEAPWENEASASDVDWNGFTQLPHGTVAWVASWCRKFLNKSSCRCQHIQTWGMLASICKSQCGFPGWKKQQRPIDPSLKFDAHISNQRHLLDSSYFLLLNVARLRFGLNSDCNRCAQ